ncbi:MAG: LysE/ArgO family amino acid transporter [Bacillota bacterium]
MEAFIHGFVLAFGLILPLGVQNVFVFNQGASQPSFIRAVPVIITASICDTLLILLAVIGVSVVVLNIAWLKTILFGVGFLFLVYMGWATWKATSDEKNEGRREAISPKKQIIFALSVSLLNPHAIIDTIGVIGTSSLYYSSKEKWIFAGAAVLVSWIWFFSLALCGRALGKLDNGGKWINYLNKVSAFIIWGTAIYIGILLYRQLVGN